MESGKRWNLIVGVLAVLALTILFCAALCADVEKKNVEASPSVPVVRILTIGDVSAEAAERISEALSAVTLEKLGCSVKLILLRSNEYDRKIDNMLVAGDLTDILLCKDRTTMEKLLNGNYIYRLDRYLTQFPVFQDNVDQEERWLQTSKDEHCYGIPFGNSSAYTWGFLMRTDLCDALGVDPTRVRTLDDLHSLLLRVRETWGDVIPVVPNYGNMDTFVEFDPLGGGIGVLGKSGTLESIAEFSDFAERCAVMHQWYEEGLILQNAPFWSASRDEWLFEGLAFGSFARINRYTERELAYSLETEVYSVILEEECAGGDVGGQSFCIYSYAKDISLCMRVLELIYSDPEFLELCIFGQEGTDFVRSPEGAALPAEGLRREERYFSWYWPLRDQAAVPMDPSDPEWYTGRAEPVGAGFLFDGESVSGQAYLCGEVIQKYFAPLCAGMLEPEEGFAAMRAELDAAGIDSFLREKTKQWEAWRAFG